MDFLSKANMFVSSNSNSGNVNMYPIEEDTRGTQLGFKSQRKILKVSTKQIGEQKKFQRNPNKPALPPGKRVSKSGKIYYERRRNRSFLPPEMRK